MSADDQLFDRVGEALAARGGWHYEPSSSPSGPPSWCLDPGGEIVVAVSVIDGGVVAYLPADDREVAFAGPDGLLAWLDEQEGVTRPT
jgi:hypothetical protein